MGFPGVECRPPSTSDSLLIISVPVRESRCEPLAAKHAEVEKGMAAIVTCCFISTNDSYLKCLVIAISFTY